jgi:hypothetical protein
MDPRTLSTRLLIKTPCKMKWSEMAGNERVRRCAACQLNVYNVSGMTEADLERFLSAGKSACVRLQRRRDGTVVTGDCQRRWRERRAKARSRLAAGGTALGAVGMLLILLVASVTLFGNNIRALFGTSATGALEGPADLAQLGGAPPPSSMASFDDLAQPPT